MKKILITGSGSYIGTSFENYIKEMFADRYIVDTVDMREDTWRKRDFGGYDAVFHVAGIAHSDSGKISVEKEKLYRSVNTDLTVETARKAKADGVKQFIFMSSVIVYGNSAPLGKERIITKNTPVNPGNCYGDSKVQAEEGIGLLADDVFKVVILRPPMIYGKGCKGNFTTLEKLALKMPVFPKIMNQRSMLYIGNLVEFVRLMIENEEAGIFFPQNSEYSNTSELVKMIAVSKGKKILLLPGFSWLLKIMSFFVGQVDKAFGNLVYEQTMSEYAMPYRIYSLKESIMKTEEKTCEH